jgi:spore coat protein H
MGARQGWAGGRCRFWALWLSLGLALGCTSAHDTGTPADPPTRDRDEADAGGAERDGGGDSPADAGGGSTGTDEDPDPGADAGPRADPTTGADPVDPDQEPRFVSEPDNPVFDQAELRHYAVTVDPEEWAHINETAYLEQYIEGEVKVDGETLESIGLRFKGFRGSLYNCFDYDDDGNVLGRTCERLSLKLAFDEYDDAQRFHGLKKLNFHAMRNDGSLMRERLASWLYRQFDVPAPRVVHATLSVNGEDQGLFALVEEIDNRFARARFPDGGEGNIYKERWPMSSAEPEYFESGLESNRSDPDLDVSPMVRFAEALMDADDDSIEDVLREHTEFDAIMRYLAVDRAIDHWDGFTAFRCRPEEDVPPLPPEVAAAQRPALGWETCQNKNYFWYERTDDDRLWLVAWDLDVTFSAFSQFPDWNTAPDSCEIQQSGRSPRCDRLIDWFATTLRPHYVSAGQALLAGPLQSAKIVEVVNGWYAQILTVTPETAALQLGAIALSGEVEARIAAFRQDLAR